MEKLSKRMEEAGRAVKKLEEITAKKDLSEIERDGMIHRFEFSFEILWKCGKDYLLTEEGLEAASPKKVIRLLREVGLFSDQETEEALAMAGDRNLTSHVYDEETALHIAERIRKYTPLMRKWYGKMAEREMKN